MDELIILEHVSGKDRAWLLAHPEYQLNTRSRTLFTRLVEERAKGVPIAYLTGVKEFYGMELKVSPRVLIPRPETEAMVEVALKSRKHDLKVIDIGTGSGAIAIAIAKQRSDWSVSATDISKLALMVAQENAKKHSVEVDFIQADLLQAPTLQGKRFDIVLANLPYVRDGTELSAEGGNEPPLALRGGPDGLDIYREFFVQLPGNLADKASVIVEADPWQHSELKRLALQQRLKTKAEDKFMLTFSR